MKKMLASLIICFCVLIFTNVDPLYASDYKESNVIDVFDVIDNPEDYDDTKVIMHEDVFAYIEVLRNDPNINKETKKELINSTLQDSRNKAVSYSYATITETVKVTSSYSCRPYFYTKFKYSGSPNPSAMVQVDYADINRSWNGISKIFGGNLHYKLETYKSLYWDLNGDFYNNGSTTVGTSFKIGIGESFALTFDAGYATDHYKYIRKTGRYKPAGILSVESL
ncbi:MAG: hypothetical protein ACTHW2_05360 [Tissierella sp.]|uniref:hypothetical protein n=1 Tax=Tissierella sp. TaxID=41274 RepID=UPI003F9A09B6